MRKRNKFNVIDVFVVLGCIYISFMLFLIIIAIFPA